MKRIRSASVSLTLIACLGMLFPPATWGESPAPPQRQRVLDVSLHQGGLLVGQVVNPQGSAQTSVDVTIIRDGRALVQAKTDHLGRFAIKGLSGGAYQLATSQSHLPIRAWTKSTAPPNVAVGAMLVDGTTVRGQCNTCNRGQSNTGYAGGGAYGAASFNQGGYGSAAYGSSVLTSSDSGYVTTEDAGAAYSGAQDDGSVATGVAPSYVEGDAYGGSYGGGYSAAGDCGYGGGAACSTGGGLFGGSGIGGVLSSPWVIGAGVAAAIAIPIALDDDDAS